MYNVQTYIYQPPDIYTNTNTITQSLIIHYVAVYIGCAMMATPRWEWNGRKVGGAHNVGKFSAELLE